MGTHPSCPSTLLEGGQSLRDYLEEHPALLGDKVVRKFGKDLPFLFKVLAIRKALSIQAHPDKLLAKKLHEERPEIYKDPNHKPEMAVALTPFSGFCGFRPPSQIAGFLSSVPEFASVLGSSDCKAFQARFAGPASAESTKAGLKSLFSALMNAEEFLVKVQVAKLVTRIAEQKHDEMAEERELIAVLNGDFPGDVGIFCTFVLNIVHLQPGEAVFLKANEPHAYLDGDIMECMATSDNVVRAGLTPKLRDVPTLTSMLSYTALPPSDQLLPPVAYKSTLHTTLYDPPIEEFSVLLTNLDAHDSETFEPIEGPSILIFTKLEKSLRMQVGMVSIEVAREGQVFFVGAGVAVTLVAGEGKATAYRAFVEVNEGGKGSHL